LPRKRAKPLLVRSYGTDLNHFDKRVIAYCESDSLTTIELPFPIPMNGVEDA